MNEYDSFFSALYSELSELVHSTSFRYLSFFVVLLFVVSGMRFILRGFESPYRFRFFSSFKPVKEKKQVFSEDDIS